MSGNRAKELVEAHWNGYVKPLLQAHGVPEQITSIVGFHYVSSGVHFYGHAVEHEREAQQKEARMADMREAIRPLPKSLTDYRATPNWTVPKDSSPLSPVFALITEEYHRSLAEHTPWEEAGHSADTMLKVIKAEVAEVDIALSMGDYDEAVKELIHVGNVAVKAIVELTRRGRL